MSANPTGPLHVGHGRQAALGDAISSLLEWTGWRVSREFYYNDAGVQIENLALSTQARVRELPARRWRFPRAATTARTSPRSRSGTSAEHPADAEGNDLDALRRFAVRELRKEQDLDLQAFGVKFDKYFLESSLYEDGRVDKTVAALIASGHTYEKDGALFLRTTDYGDDQDRVMRKSAEKGGTFTYFVPDVAYHVTKWERGFTRAINVQGADHHSTVTRVRAGLQALDIGIPEGLPGVRAAPDGDGDARRRRGEDLQARGQLRHRARSHRRGGARRGALFLPHAEGRLAARLRRRSRALAERREPRLLHPDGARAALRHLSRGRDRPSEPRESRRTAWTSRSSRSWKRRS